MNVNPSNWKVRAFIPGSKVAPSPTDDRSCDSESESVIFSLPRLDNVESRNFIPIAARPADDTHVDADIVGIW